MTVRPGSALSFTFTVTERPSVTEYELRVKRTVTNGSTVSSSATVTVTATEAAVTVA